MPLITILAFMFILGFSVTIHEFGHFLVAKLFKIPVEKFSIGYGPPLVRWKMGETDFRIAYLPLGGYVKIQGEDDEKDLVKPPSKDAPARDDDAAAAPAPAEPEPEAAPIKNASGHRPGFYDVPVYKRALVVASGPIFNIVSAVVVIALIYLAYGVMTTPYLKVKVEPTGYAFMGGLRDGDSLISVNGERISTWSQFEAMQQRETGKEVAVQVIRNGTPMEHRLYLHPDSLGLLPRIPAVLGSMKMGGPAQRAGLRSGDRVLSVDGQAVADWYELVEQVRSVAGRPMEIEYWRDGVAGKVVVTPTTVYDSAVGDSVGQIEVMMPVARQRMNLGEAVVAACRSTGELIWLTLKTLYQVVVGTVSRRALGGPIAIFQMSGEFARWGFDRLLWLLAVISVNLGLVNLFPIPALDGGQILIGVFEAIRRKRLSLRTRIIIQQVGWALLLLLIIYVTYNDLTR